MRNLFYVKHNFSVEKGHVFWYEIVIVAIRVFSLNRHPLDARFSFCQFILQAVCYITGLHYR